MRQRHKRGKSVIETECEAPAGVAGRAANFGAMIAVKAISFSISIKMSVPMRGAARACAA